MFIGVMATQPLQDHEAETTSIGQFEMKLSVDMKEAERSGAPEGFIRHYIAQCAASAIAQTGVPPELWGFVASPQLLRAFPNFPKMFALG